MSPASRIRSRHQPFEVATLLIAPLCGVLLVVLDVRPPSVRITMPPPIQAGWEFGLIVAGLAGLAGILWPGRVSTGLGIELASLLMLGAITSMYALALVVVAGTQAVAVVAFILSVSAGSFWRCGQIVCDLRRLALISRSIAVPLPEGESA
ncbi:hypothetical protein [Micromonospora sp. URMC 103]|uniref:hypothetical protein n=1 Tax=Micromonospora sp. URMC 103 TaxID=3423406 RepID=UPI003F1C5201